MSSIEELLLEAESRVSSLDDWIPVSGYEIVNSYSDDEGPVEINGRTINSLSNEISVQGESNSQYINFIANRYVDGIDLSTMIINIHYELNDEEGSTDAPINVFKNDRQIKFGWAIPNAATKYDGIIKICVIAIGIIEGRNYVFKTEPYNYTVKRGLNAGTGIIEPDDDWYVQFILRARGDIDTYVGTKLTYFNDVLDEAIVDFNEKAEEVIESIPEDYSALDKKVDDLAESVANIELFKFPNAVIYGEPTINNGQISGFTENDYLALPFLFDIAGRSFELRASFTTGGDVDSIQNIIGSNYCIALLIEDKNLIFRVSNDGLSWNVMDEELLEVSPYTTYYVKVLFNRLSYKVEYSVDGKTYSQVAYKVTTLVPKANQIYFGIGMNYNPFLGMINFNKLELLENNIVIWEGMDDVGLASRLATDLENIDEAGIKKIKEISKESIPVDDELSLDSENPVQNKVITGKINEIESDIDVVNVSDSVLEKSADGNIRSLHLLGNGRKSKNLLDNADYINGYTTVNAWRDFGGGNITHVDGCLRFTKMESSSASPRRSTNLVVGKTYTIFAKVRANNTIQFEIGLWEQGDRSRQLYAYHGAISENWSVIKGTVDDLKGTLPPLVYIRNNDSLLPIDSYIEIEWIMIVEGTSTDDTYEPYGLIISEGIVESGTSNIIEGTDNWDGAWINANRYSNDGYYKGLLVKKGTVTGNGIHKMFNAKKGVTYTISVYIKTSINSAQIFCYKKSTEDTNLGRIVIPMKDTWERISYSYTPSDDEYIGMRIESSNDSELSICGYMVSEDGNTEYVSYGHSSINASEILNSTFTGVNDIKDELIVNVDGSGKFTKKTFKMDLSTLNWTPCGSTSQSKASTLPKNAPLYDSTVITNIIAENYNSISRNNIYINSEEGIAVNGQYIYCTDRNPSGNVVYEVEAPIIYNLTPTEVSQLLSLKTFTDKTLIIADCEHEIGYFVNSEVGQSVADINSYFINQIKGLSEIIVGLT